MRLVELTRISGMKLAINPEYVVYVSPSTVNNNNTVIVLAGPATHTYEVQENYSDVTRILTGASVGRDERGRFSVKGAV